MDEWWARRAADIVRSGVTRDQLRGPSFERRGHGLHRPSGLDLPPDVARVSDAVGLLRPGQAIGGWASLRLQGNSFFTGWSSQGTRPALVHCGPRTQLRRRDVVEPFRGTTHPEELLHLEGIAMTTMARAVFDEARMAPSVDEAVVAFDMAVSTTHGLPHTSVRAVRQVMDSHFKVRGMVQARSALDLASSRSASPWETRSRLMAREAGIVQVLVNVPIFGPTGELLGIVDLVEPESGLVVETDGGHHRELEQHTEDNRREERLELHGCVVARVTVLDHQERWQTIARLRAAHLQAMSSPRGSWTLEPPPWWHLWEPGARWR